MNKTITIERTIKAPIERVFDAFITPDDLVKWHSAGGGWTTPHAIIDAQPGGKFNIGYQDPNGEFNFDFTGTYTEIDRPNKIAYTIDDGRKVEINFEEVGENQTHVRWEFEMESENPEEMQRAGWNQQLVHLGQLLDTE